jgi:HAE1 family hydrophobic/amphiphilic exporter-1
MIASTCLAALFVPSFFAVLQRFEECKASKIVGESFAPSGKVPLKS